MSTSVPSLTSQQIGDFGERAVEDVLVKSGYRCIRNTRLPSATDIIASNGHRILRIQVKARYLFGNEWPTMTLDERISLKLHATLMGQEPWIANVVINIVGELVGAIEWKAPE
jgi:Holliday junction resolvase-like predicted endonuclease